MKYLNWLLLFVLVFYSCNQNKRTETESNNEFRDEILEEKNEKNNPVKTLIKFYENQDKINVLDKLISFRFYSKTPFVEFKKTMEAKNLLFGVFKKMRIIKFEYSSDKNIISYLLYVDYEKSSTYEKIVLIKESKNDTFKIFEYDIKHN